MFRDIATLEGRSPERPFFMQKQPLCKPQKSTLPALDFIVVSCIILYRVQVFLQSINQSLQQEAIMATKGKMGYRINLQKPRDKDILNRNRESRLAMFIVALVVIVGAPTALVGWWGSMADYPNLGILIGFGIGGWFASRIIPDRMVIYNPEWTGYVTQNMFKGTMIPYGPGLHFSHLWEERNKAGNYSLKVITRPLEASISTKTSKVVVKGEYEYAIYLARIENAIGVGESTIEDGLTAFIESFLISKCDHKDAETVRGMIVELNNALANEFMDTENAGKKPSHFEETYGFVTVSIVIDNIAFPAAVQETRDAIDKAVQLHKVVASMYGITPKALAKKLSQKEISVKDYNTMLNRAMAASGNAKMDVHVIEADIPAIIAELAKKVTTTKGGTS